MYQDNNTLSTPVLQIRHRPKAPGFVPRAPACYGQGGILFRKKTNPQ
jgi:hypothetical protein